MKPNHGSVAALVLLFLLAPGSVSRAAPPALAPGDQAPRLEGTTIEDGQTVQIDWTGSKLTVVNFWATWCRYCKDQMPMLQQLWAAHKAEGLTVVGVYDQGDAPEAIRAYFEPLGVEYPILQAGDKTNMAWGGIHALPTSFLIDGRGKVLRRYVGATPEQTRGLVADVEAVLAGRRMDKLVIPVEPAASEPSAPIEGGQKRGNGEAE